MFTGLIETTGRVKSLKKTGEVYTLSLEAQEIAEFIGQSISVSGACLTVTALSQNGKNFDVEIMPETFFNRTWFKDYLKPGLKVNLERALKLKDRLDGHLVLGHVDGTAVLKNITGEGSTKKAFFETSQDILRGIVSKGSVAIDGVSLTVIDVDDKNSLFSVGLIPTTLKNCTLRDLKTGMKVNIETDILGKFVERLLFSNKINNKNNKNDKDNKNNKKISFEELIELGY